ncbi:MAG: SDR family NAD(P)-dependent oxidoreductase [Azospirillaceae bacterium]
MRGLGGMTVLVTGASGGIGRAIVARLVEEGARVCAAARDEARLDALAGVTPLRLDVTREEDWRAAVARLGADGHGLDGLVNNAGDRASGRVEETTDALWHAMIETNLTSVFRGCRACLPLLRERGGGAIVNVGSITGIRGTEAMVAYSASKSGITAMTASLALDHAGDGIRVNAVCPAATDTRMVREMLDGAPDRPAAERALVAKHPMGRAARVEEVAGTVAFLLSADAGFITGQSIAVDGGRSMR